MSIHSDQVLKVELFRKSASAYYIACVMELDPERKGAFWKLANPAERKAIQEYADAKVKAGL